MMMSGLSGNEIYCLAQKGWTPGNIVVGNSVYSLGFLGSITSGLRMIAGGEIENITRLISDGRHAAVQRLGRGGERGRRPRFDRRHLGAQVRERLDGVSRHRLSPPPVRVRTSFVRSMPATSRATS